MPMIEEKKDNFETEKVCYTTCAIHSFIFFGLLLF